MIWDQLTFPELDELNRNIPVVLPVTATEQHGPHLPLATDRLIGEYFAHILHNAVPNQVLVLPAVTIGCSNHHMDFTGTLTFSHNSFSNLIQDIVGSIINHDFDRVVLLNSHGGNQAIGQVLTEQLGDHYPEAHVVMATWWRIASEELKNITETGPGGVGHAGEFETSLMMQIAPDLVRVNEIDSGTNTETFSWAEADMLRGSQASYYRSMKQMTGNGVFGDSTGASKEKGQKIIDSVIPALKKIVLDLGAIGD